ncbi:TPA: tyrosine-type recombinase/integrase [Vibrio parahaemolyticus]|nr:tyrosine-type recombinase/integrase [Vibrio parahaemolyticus]
MTNKQIVEYDKPYRDPLVHTALSAQAEIASDLSDDAKKLLQKSFSKATLDAYLSDSRVFCAWCAVKNVNPGNATTGEIINFLTDQTVGKLNRWVWTDKAARLGYLTSGEPLAYSTIYRRLNGVKFALKKYYDRSFTETELQFLSDIMKGVAAELGTDKRKVKGIYIDDLRIIFSQMDLTDQVDLRDRAILMLLFAGAFRRSEIVQLEYVNVKLFPGKGLKIKLDKVKRKQNGMVKIIVAGGKGEMCPVSFLSDYLAAAEIKDGFIFRRANRNRKMLSTPLTGDAINKMVKERCERAGLEGLYGGHSGRRGFVETSVSAGKTMNKVMQMTGHKSVQILQEYFDDAEAWDDDNAGFGLY